MSDVSPSPSTKAHAGDRPVPSVRRTRTRRGSEVDHARFRQTALEAAKSLYRQGGLDAVTMRAVASRVGASPMLLYHYFADKTELIVALWDDILKETIQQVSQAVARASTARERLHASTATYIRYWEEHPENFKLVFLTDLSTSKLAKTGFEQSDEYQQVIQLSISMLKDFAREIGASEKNVMLAKDLRVSMMVGYLHSRIFNIRYPWDDLDALRTATLDAIMSTLEKCLLSGG